MQYVLVLLVLVAVPCTIQGNIIPQLAFQPRYLEGVVNATFNKIWQERIKPIDPLHLDSVETGALGNYVVAEDITVEGFSDAYLSQLKLTGLLSPKMEATLLIPFVTSYVDNLEVELDDGSMGQGSASILLENLRIYISAKIKIASLTATDVKVRPNLERGTVTITGNNDEEVLQEITDLFEHFLNDTLNNDESLHAQISNIVQGIINNLGDNREFVETIFSE